MGRFTLKVSMSSKSKLKQFFLPSRRPKHEQNAELLISNVMTAVKSGFASCAVAFDSVSSVPSYRHCKCLTYF